MTPCSAHVGRRTIGNGVHYLLRCFIHGCICQPAFMFRYQVVVEKHRHEGVFIARGKEDALVTKNMVPGESVYGEKRIASEACVPI